MRCNSETFRNFAQALGTPLPSRGAAARKAKKDAEFTNYENVTKENVNITIE